MKNQLSLEDIISFSRDIETILTEKHQATGKGLHDKLSSVEKLLSSELVKKIRWVATVRNKALHESDFSLMDIEDLPTVANEILSQLSELEKPSFSEEIRSKFISERVGSGIYNLLSPPNERVLGLEKEEQETQIRLAGLGWSAGITTVLFFWIPFIIENWWWGNRSMHMFISFFFAGPLAVMLVIGLILFLLLPLKDLFFPVVEGMDACTDLDLLGEVADIKDCNPIVASYLKKLSVTNRKLTNDEVSLLLQFHDWAIEQNDIKRLRGREAELYS